MKKEYYCKHSTHINLTSAKCKMQLETDNLNSLITNKETELVILKLPKKTSPGLGSITGEFCRAFKELTPVLHISSRKQKRREYFPIHFMKLILS